MTLSASEFYEAALNLPPSVRKDLALRLLESVEETWTDEISSRVDEIISGEVKTIPHEEVLSRLAEHRAARRSARQQA